MEFMDRLSESAGLCVLFACIFGLLAMIEICFIVSGLFAMHRSKNGLKKAKMGYTFRQRLLLRPAWEQCLHAKTFCRVLICVYYIRVIVLAISCLFAVVVQSNPALLRVAAYIVVISILALDAPIFVLDFILDEHPFKKWQNKYRFEKYHNTRDRSSLI